MSYYTCRYNATALTRRMGNTFFIIYGFILCYYLSIQGHVQPSADGENTSD